MARIEIPDLQLRKSVDTFHKIPMVSGGHVPSTHPAIDEQDIPGEQDPSVPLEQ